MHGNFEELDYQRTPIGELILRRRHALEVDGREIFEVKLIDHTPEALLNPSHADLYSENGMMRLRSFLKPGGVFRLWSKRPRRGFASGHSVTRASIMNCCAGSKNRFCEDACRMR